MVFLNKAIQFRRTVWKLKVKSVSKTTKVIIILNYGAIAKFY